MPTPHSEGLRVRVIEAVVVEGMSCRAAAKRLKVAEATAIRWVEAYREEGRIGPLPMGGDRRSVLKPHRAWLLALRRAENEPTLEAVAERLRAAFGVRADTSMLSRFFRSEGISFKKPCTPASKRGPTWPRRARNGATRSLISSLPLGGRLIFLDETGLGPTWSAAMPGRPSASAHLAMRRADTGRPPPSSPASPIKA